MWLRTRPLEARLGGSYLLFSSGNASTQARASVTSTDVRIGNWRVHAGATGGISEYQSAARSSHALWSLGTTRAWSRWAAWAEGGGGWSDAGDHARQAWLAGVGVRRRLGTTVVSTTVTAGWVGDTQYVDLVARGGRVTGPWRLDWSIGARLPSHGAGEGFYAEATALVTISGGAGVFVGGGRYPADPLRGTIAGNYVTGGVRLAAARRLPRRPVAPHVEGGTDGTAATAPFAVSLEVRASGDSVALRIAAPEATAVEVMGGFTGWEPVALQPVGGGVWERRFRLPPGQHRLNVRVDGGAWDVPRGATAVDDGFGGVVGTFVVP